MSKRGHLPTRMCVGCRKRRKKIEMVRFVLKKEERPLLPADKKEGGRGIYLCPDPSCLTMARKKYPALFFQGVEP